MLGEEDEEETVHQEVLLDEEQEVPLDGLVILVMKAMKEIHDSHLKEFHFQDVEEFLSKQCLDSD